ncbi:hypothetical protein GCM10009626_02610 [Brachybacterium sacelli]
MHWGNPLVEMSPSASDGPAACAAPAVAIISPAASAAAFVHVDLTVTVLASLLHIDSDTPSFCEAPHKRAIDVTIPSGPREGPQGSDTSAWTGAWSEG